MKWKIKLLLPVAALFAMLIFAGCTQGQQPASSQVQPGANQNYVVDSGAQGQMVAGQQQPAAGQPQAQQGAGGYCMGMSGDGLIQCTYERAKSSNDVAACTALVAQADRNICIAQWCGSEMRDYTQCDRLSNYDDNLGCLSKCNPNPNT